MFSCEFFGILKSTFLYTTTLVAASSSRSEPFIKLTLSVLGLMFRVRVKSKVNPLSPNPTKWSNTFKQFVDNNQPIV